MSIVVTTPTGNIGRVLVRELLAAGEQPVLIARDPAKLGWATAQGATVVQGSHDDPSVVVQATRGARALFVLTPPDLAMHDIRAHYARFGRAAASAIHQNGIRQVVHLSSVGADLESGNGPVAGLYLNEGILAEVAPNLVQLRPGYFMENTLGQIGSILQAGALFTTFPAGAIVPMIATRDIGAVAAALLRDPDWTGQRVVELHGAADFSYEQVAEVLSELLARPMAHVTITPEAQRQALMGMGLSQVLADSFAELADAVAEGRMRFHEARSAENTTPTSYATFAREVFLPAFEAAAGAGGAQG